MYNTKICKNYAGALFCSALNNNIEKIILAEIISFQKIIENSHLLQHIICTPITSAAQKTRIIKNIAQKLNLHIKVRTCLMLIASHNRMMYLKHIIDCYSNMYNTHIGIKNITVISAKKLTTHDNNSIKEILKEKLQTSIIIDNITNPKLIGGFIVKYDSYLIDYSILSMINNIKNMANKALLYTK